MTSIDPRIFRAYDIRGLAHHQLTPEACTAIGAMFGTILREMYGIDHPRVAIGGDARTHSPAFVQAACDGLVSAGCHVLNIGPTPTPINYFTVCDQHLDGGLQITASHNPKEDNGIKLQVRESEAFSGEELQMLRRRIEEGNYLTGEGTVESIDAVTPYMDFLVNQFEGIGAGKTVVIDCGNGIPGPVYTQVLQRIGCTLIALYTVPDGEFPNHPADPSQYDTLKELQESVLREKAALGFAFDGDGDRVGLVDELGIIRTSDEVLLLLARGHLHKHPGAPVVFTVSNSGVLDTEIKKWGGVPVMCKVGHSFVEHTMREHNATLGGEQSGHFFCADNYFGFDDGLMAALHILQTLGTHTVSQAMADFPPVFQAQERRPHCPDDHKSRIIESVIAHFSATHTVNTLDGARIDFGEGAWAGIRQSNTSPKISICIEARSAEKLAAVEAEVLGYLKTYPEIVW